MHLFLVREADMAGFAHLHPVRPTTNVFESILPPLPFGRYSVYADVTHETGFSETLTATVELTNVVTMKAGLLTDSDDSWFVGQPARDFRGSTRRGRVPHRSCRKQPWE